jgi:hypothetical protein
MAFENHIQPDRINSAENQKGGVGREGLEDTDPSPADQAAQSEPLFGRLLSEYRRRRQAGEDPARLSEVEEELYKCRLREIEEGLASIARRPGLRTLFELEAGLEDALQPYELATCRTDLTVPELLFLKKLRIQEREEIRQALLAEQEELERRLYPGKRRKGPPA